MSVAKSFGVFALAAAIGVVAPPAWGQLTTEQARSLARDVYCYAYPLVLMDITRQQMTSTTDSTAAPTRMQGPVNQFVHLRSFPKADDRAVVRPNFDTLYSSAWLDLTAGPIVLSVPDTAGRYYLAPLLDMWTDVFAVPGTRTTGGKAGDFAIAPPGWKGELPKGVELIRAPTPIVWIIGRTQTNGTADFDAVHKVQDAFRLTPLAQWGQQGTPAQAVAIDSHVDTGTPPVLQVNRLNGIAMFGRLAELLKIHPPHANDYPILARMKAIGLEPGKDFALAKDFDASKLGSPVAAAINAGAEDALEDLKQGLQAIGTHAGGWTILTENIGTYGTSYRQRAIIAMSGLGANLPADAIYPTAFLDGDGKPLDGAGKYRLHFDKGMLPPANAFWSLTVYDDQSFQVPNSIERFALGDRDKLAFNSDGSLDIFFQTGSPGEDRQTNWLPVPKSGPFNVTLRMYSPRREALEGTWLPPAIAAIK